MDNHLHLGGKGAGTVPTSFFHNVTGRPEMNISEQQGTPGVISLL